MPMNINLPQEHELNEAELVNLGHALKWWGTYLLEFTPAEPPCEDLCITPVDPANLPNAYCVAPEPYGVPLWHQNGDGFHEYMYKAQPGDREAWHGYISSEALPQWDRCPHHGPQWVQRLGVTPGGTVVAHEPITLACGCRIAYVDSNEATVLEEGQG